MIGFSELELISAAKAGDRDAFERIVLDNESALYRLALRSLRNPEDAADAVQETFLKAYTGLASFRGDSRIFVWLYRILSNVCTDILRRRRDTVSLSPDEDGALPELEIPDTRHDPAALAERSETRAQVRAALARLPEDFQRPLLLREYAGLSYEEIAGLLGLPQATVKTRIFRARKKLCALLSADGNFSASAASKAREGGERT